MKIEFPFETTYLEERLYAVRCRRCDTVTLTKESNPLRADLHVGMAFTGEA